MRSPGAAMGGALHHQRAKDSENHWKSDRRQVQAIFETGIARIKAKNNHKSRVL